MAIIVLHFTAQMGYNKEKRRAAVIWQHEAQT